MFLASPKLETIDFQTGYFADLKQFKTDSHSANFGQVKIDPTYSFFTDFGRVSYFTDFGCVSYLTDFGQGARPRKTIRLTNNSRTTHRIWHKSF